MEDLEKLNTHKAKARKYMIFFIIFLVLTIFMIVFILHSLFNSRKNVIYFGSRSKFYSYWIILLPLIPCIIFFILYKIEKGFIKKLNSK